jgi:ankyrin repeat protein
MLQSPLLEASSKGHTGAVTALLAAGADVNAADVFGATPLIAASREGKLDVVLLLLAAGAEVLSPVLVSDGGDALMRATRRNHVPVADALIKSGANVDKRDKQGRTPIMYAVQENNKDMVALLIAGGADINLFSPDKVSAMRWARTYKRAEIEELLLKAGAKAPPP